MVSWVLAASVLLGALGLWGWCWADVGRLAPPRGRRWWRATLIVALAAIPVLPGLSVPLRVERTWYEGPDLLSSQPLETWATRDRWVVPGVLRERGLRTVQGTTLLEERARLEAGIPWLLLLVVSAWVGIGSRRAHRGRGRGGDEP